MLERTGLRKSLEQKRLRRSEPYLYDMPKKLHKIAASNFGIRVTNHRDTKNRMRRLPSHPVAHTQAAQKPGYCFV